jgi:hypothetical protein
MQKLLGDNGLDGATCPAQMRNALRVIKKYDLQFDVISVEAKDLKGEKIDIPKDDGGRIALYERFKKGEVTFSAADPIHEKALEELYQTGFAPDEVVPVPNEKATIALNPEKILSGEYYVLALTGIKPGATERGLVAFTQGGIHGAGRLECIGGIPLEHPKIKLFVNYSEYAIVDPDFQRDGVQDPIHVVTAAIGREMSRREGGILVKKWGEQELRGQGDVTTEKRAVTYTNKGWENTQGQHGQHIHMQPQVNPDGAAVPLNPVERALPLTSGDRKILEQQLPHEVKQAININELNVLPPDCWTKSNEVEKRNGFDRHFALLGRGLEPGSREISEARQYFDTQMQSIDQLVHRPLNQVPDLIDQAKTNSVLANQVMALYEMSGNPETPEGRQAICDKARPIYDAQKEQAGWPSTASALRPHGG